MTKHLTADDITTAIYDMEATTRAATVASILDDLADFYKSGPVDGDVDTWESGFRAAMEVISANYR
jgi:hypothetical protein